MRSSLLVVVLTVAGCTNSVPAPRPASSEQYAAAWRMYRCRSGRTVEVSYPSIATAAVRYQNQTYSMAIAVSASGARYIGGGLEWWTKGSGPGSEGTIFHHESTGTTGEAIDTCAQAAGGGPRG